MAKNCHNHSFVEIGSSSIFPLFCSVAGQRIIDTNEPRCTAAATVYGNGNGMMETRHNSFYGLYS